MGNKVQSCRRENIGDCTGMKQWLKRIAPLPEDDNSISSAPKLVAAYSETFNETEEMKICNEIDLELALDQIFLLCESGAASTIDFILNSHPGLLSMLNNQRSCIISNIPMHLTPLQLAAASGNTDAMRALLMRSSVQANASDPEYAMTALHLTVVLSQMFSLEELCRDSRVTYDNRTVEGKTALHLAVELEYSNMVETILRLHPTVDLRTRDFEGNNVFHLAAMHPNVRIMEQLINHASLVYLYGGSFCAQQYRERDRPHKLIKTLSRPIFEALNYNRETPHTILTNTIRRVQQQQQHQLQQRSHSRDSNILQEPPPRLPQSSSPRDVFIAGTGSECLDEQFNQSQVSAEPLSSGGLTTRLSSETSSPDTEEYNAIEVDMDTLLQCLEILVEAVLPCPSPVGTLSTFGLRSVSSSQRKCSFDLESFSSELGDSDSSGNGHRSGAGGKGNRHGSDSEEEREEENAAYSWSPPYTPSLDPPEKQHTPSAGRPSRS